MGKVPVIWDEPKDSTAFGKVPVIWDQPLDFETSLYGIQHPSRPPRPPQGAAFDWTMPPIPGPTSGNIQEMPFRPLSGPPPAEPPPPHLRNPTQLNDIGGDRRPGVLPEIPEAVASVGLGVYAGARSALTDLARGGADIINAKGGYPFTVPKPNRYDPQKFWQDLEMDGTLGEAGFWGRLGRGVGETAGFLAPVSAMMAGLGTVGLPTFASQAIALGTVSLATAKSQADAAGIPFTQDRALSTVIDGVIEPALAGPIVGEIAGGMVGGRYAEMLRPHITNAATGAFFEIAGAQPGESTLEAGLHGALGFSLNTVHAKFFGGLHGAYDAAGRYREVRIASRALNDAAEVHLNPSATPDPTIDPLIRRTAAINWQRNMSVLNAIAGVRSEPTRVGETGQFKTPTVEEIMAEFPGMPQTEAAVIARNRMGPKERRGLVSAAVRDRVVEEAAARGGQQAMDEARYRMGLMGSTEARRYETDIRPNVPTNALQAIPTEAEAKILLRNEHLDSLVKAEDETNPPAPTETPGDPYLTGKRVGEPRLQQGIRNDPNATAGDITAERYRDVNRRDPQKPYGGTLDQPQPAAGPLLDAQGNPLPPRPAETDKFTGAVDVASSEATARLEAARSNAPPNGNPGGITQVTRTARREPEGPSTGPSSIVSSRQLPRPGTETRVVHGTEVVVPPDRNPITDEARLLEQTPGEGPPIPGRPPGEMTQSEVARAQEQNAAGTYTETPGANKLTRPAKVAEAKRGTDAVYGKPQSITWRGQEKAFGHPLVAVVVKGGKVVADPYSKTHEDLLKRKGIAADKVVGRGMVQDGQYRDGESPRTVTETPSKPGAVASEPASPEATSPGSTEPSPPAPTESPVVARAVETSHKKVRGAGKKTVTELAAESTPAEASPEVVAEVVQPLKIDKKPRKARLKGGYAGILELGDKASRAFMDSPEGSGGGPGFESSYKTHMEKALGQLASQIKGRRASLAEYGALQLLEQAAQSTGTAPGMRISPAEYVRIMTDASIESVGSGFTDIAAFMNEAMMPSMSKRSGETSEQRNWRLQKDHIFEAADEIARYEPDTIRFLADWKPRDFGDLLDHLPTEARRQNDIKVDGRIAAAVEKDAVRRKRKGKDKPPKPSGPDADIPMWLVGVGAAAGAAGAVYALSDDKKRKIVLAGLPFLVLRKGQIFGRVRSAEAFDAKRVAETPVRPNVGSSPADAKLAWSGSPGPRAIQEIVADLMPSTMEAVAESHGAIVARDVRGQPTARRVNILKAGDEPNNAEMQIHLGDYADMSRRGPKEANSRVQELALKGDRQLERFGPTGQALVRGARFVRRNTAAVTGRIQFEHAQAVKEIGDPIGHDFTKRLEGKDRQNLYDAFEAAVDGKPIPRMNTKALIRAAIVLEGTAGIKIDLKPEERVAVDKMVVHWKDLMARVAQDGGDAIPGFRALPNYFIPHILTPETFAPTGRLRQLLGDDSLIFKAAVKRAEYLQGKIREDLAVTRPSLTYGDVSAHLMRMEGRQSDPLFNQSISTVDANNANFLEQKLLIDPLHGIELDLPAIFDKYIPNVYQRIEQAHFWGPNLELARDIVDVAKADNQNTSAMADLFDLTSGQVPRRDHKLIRNLGKMMAVRSLGFSGPRQLGSWATTLQYPVVYREGLRSAHDAFLQQISELPLPAAWKKRVFDRDREIFNHERGHAMRNEYFSFMEDAAGLVGKTSHLALKYAYGVHPADRFGRLWASAWARRTVAVKMAEFEHAVRSGDVKRLEHNQHLVREMFQDPLDQQMALKATHTPEEVRYLEGSMADWLVAKSQGSQDPGDLPPAAAKDAMVAEFMRFQNFNYVQTAESWRKWNVLDSNSTVRNPAARMKLFAGAAVSLGFSGLILNKAIDALRRDDKHDPFYQKVADTLASAALFPMAFTAFDMATDRYRQGMKSAVGPTYGFLYDAASAPIKAIMARNMKPIQKVAISSIPEPYWAHFLGIPNREDLRKNLKGNTTKP